MLIAEKACALLHQRNHTHTTDPRLQRKIHISINSQNPAQRVHNHTIYERIKKAATRAEDVKIDSILGLETKALFTKDELDSRVEILVKYKEKKNNKDDLNITIGRISNKLDPREAFNSPKVKEILSGIKIK